MIRTGCRYTRRTRPHTHMRRRRNGTLTARPAAADGHAQYLPSGPHAHRAGGRAHGGRRRPSERHSRQRPPQMVDRGLRGAWRTLRDLAGYPSRSVSEGPCPGRAGWRAGVAKRPVAPRAALGLKHAPAPYGGGSKPTHAAPAECVSPSPRSLACRSRVKLTHTQKNGPRSDT